MSSVKTIYKIILCMSILNVFFFTCYISVLILLDKPFNINEYNIWSLLYNMFNKV